MELLKVDDFDQFPHVAFARAKRRALSGFSAPPLSFIWNPEEDRFCQPEFDILTPSPKGADSGLSNWTHYVPSPAAKLVRASYSAPELPAFPRKKAQQLLFENPFRGNYGDMYQEVEYSKGW